MPAIKLLNIFALSTFAVLICSLAPSQTLAVSIRANHLARELPNHQGIAKKKRAKRECKPRSSSSSPPPSSTPASNPSTTPKDNNLAVTSSKSVPSPSSSNPPSTTPTNTPTGPGKLAIAWALGNDPRLTKIIEHGRVKIIHLWDSEIPTAVKATKLPVSIMLWSDAQARVDRFKKFANPGYATHAYGFNEVNEGGQANMGVNQAVTAWKAHLQPLASQGYILGSPSTSSNPNGFVWTEDFFNKCTGCTFDEVQIHWYDITFDGLKEYIEKWAGFGKPLRLTEFACQNFNDVNDQPTNDEIWEFNKQAVEYMENDPRILSYAPFGFMDGMSNVNVANRLFTTGGLSDLGTAFATGEFP